jgi:large subunit ribosomal protein L23
MALFGKKKADAPKKEEMKKAMTAKAKGTVVGASHYLLAPRVTERATVLAEGGVYVFDVAPTATAGHISQAIREVYKVTPVKVNMTTVRAKKVFVRGKMGMQAGGKKAYVYLRKGDKIEIV